MYNNKLNRYRAEAKEHDVLRAGVDDFRYLDFWYAGDPKKLIGTKLPCTPDHRHRAIKNDKFVVDSIVQLAVLPSGIERTDNVIGNLEVEYVKD